MPIHVTDDPDVHVTRKELQRYRQRYTEAYMFFAGEPPTLAEFIRRRRNDKRWIDPNITNQTWR